jgi:hypothetical protein
VECKENSRVNSLPCRPETENRPSARARETKEINESGEEKLYGDIKRATFIMITRSEGFSLGIKKLLKSIKISMHEAMDFCSALCASL